MKKLLALSLVCTLGLSLAACGGSSSTSSSASAPAQAEQASSSAQPAQASAYHYIMGHGAAEKSIGDLYCLKFKELVEEKSNGRVTVDVYSGSQLGTYGEMMQSMQNGDIGGMIFQPSPAVSFIPELAVLDMPFAFVGYTKEQIDKALNHSEFTEIIDASFEKSGYKRMSFAQAATFREVTSSREMRTAEDFKGLKIRTLENNNHIMLWKSLGANPTPIAFGELYLSLQQGLVEAQENPYDTSLAAKFAEVQKYIIDTHHILYPNLFLVNKALYDSMDAEAKAAFDAAAEEAKAYAEQLMEESAQTSLQGLVDAGLIHIEIPADELQKMADAARPPVEELVRAGVGDEVVDIFFSALES